MYVLCIQSSMEWFTPGKRYPADVVDSQKVLIRGDNAVSDLNPEDSWLAVRDMTAGHVWVRVPFKGTSAEFAMADVSP
ncbi:TPA: hypothetical protein RMT71_003163 [Escherichia coli]|nr:hypothetical protein [Escherichia coli]